MKTVIIAVASLPALAALALVSNTAPAQAYPSKPIRLIVPWPPGGGTDAAARILAQALSDNLGEQVVLDNRPGATGRIGTEFAARAPADGYTLLMGTVGPNAIVPAASPKLPYDANRSTSLRRAAVPWRTLRASSSNNSPKSTWCTCRTKAAARPLPRPCPARCRCTSAAALPWCRS
ncbi:MAG: hypothetical protein HYU73_08665 [Betaproteobacteria bacterium]|nr:hypothetical protein [Betaproteobacteria bacterium]